jgi:hypothetical protein
MEEMTPAVKRRVLLYDRLAKEQESKVLIRVLSMKCRVQIYPITVSLNRL